MSFLGDPSGEDVQVAGRVRFDHSSLTVDYQEDLDERTAVGRIHRLCEGDRAGQLRGVVAVTQRATQGPCRETTGAEERLKGLCRKESGKQSSDGWVLGYLWRR